MAWTVLLAGPAKKSLDRVPKADRARILAALAEMEQNPFHGDANCKASTASLAASATGDHVRNALRPPTDGHSHCSPQFDDVLATGRPPS